MSDNIRRNYVKAGDGEYYLEEKNRAPGSVATFYDGKKKLTTIPRPFAKVLRGDVPAARLAELDGNPPPLDSPPHKFERQNLDVAAAVKSDLTVKPPKNTKASKPKAS